jgi:hypothetical protein
VSHYARCEDDVEPAVVRASIDRVTSTLNTTSSMTFESTVEHNVVRVTHTYIFNHLFKQGSVYKRTIPAADTSLTSNREAFWSKVEVSALLRHNIYFFVDNMLSGDCECSWGERNVISL